MRLAVGDQLGPYVVEAPLGEGGMGEVYRAHDPRLGRRLALKVLRVDGVDQETRRRFLQEARAASALSHPGIVTVFDVGNQDDVDFIAMELVDGTSLDRLLQAGPLPPARALSVAEQIADALARAHGEGIVHRDLKPANVIVGPGDRIKLLDFGVAKVIDAARSAAISTLSGAPMTTEGAIVGTVAYMSPEQAEGQAVDGRSDIFSLGVVLFQMLAGYAPFKRKSAASTLAAILHEPIKSLRDVDRTIPEEVDRLVERCVRKDPARRFQTMADLRVTLIDAREALRSPVGVASGTATIRSRAPWGLAALGGAAAALVVFGLGPWISDGTQSAAHATLTRMTTDGVFTVDPAMSPDGTLLAFASDRGGEGGTNIWVQQVAGGLPIQVTSLQGDEREPAFSADGARVVFRSEVDGGLYVVSALGGQDPRLLAPEGRRPRISPDGRSVAYWTGFIVGFVSDPGGYRTYVMPIEGGQAREVEGFTGVRYPTWIDSESLLVLASTAPLPTPDTYDWWLVRLDGRPPVNLRAYETLAAAGANVAGGDVPPGSWRDGTAFFSDLSSLWSIPVSADGRRLGTPERLTFGSARDIQPVAGGDALAFVSYSQSTNIWGLPLDANRGEVSGALAPITSGSGPHTRATLTADGRSIAYNSFGSSGGAPLVLVLDLESRRVVDTGIRGSAFGSAISPDGASVAYQSEGGVSVAPVRGGASRRVCETCQVGEWTRDGRRIAVASGPGGNGHIFSIDVESGESRGLVLAGDAPLNRPHFNPDNRLLAFRIFSTTSQSVRIAPVGEAPAPQESWIAIGDPEADLRPAGWSPDGSLLYLLSGRDGYRCLYAQPVDPTTGEPRGDAFAVWHSHDNSWLTGRETSLSTGPSSAVGPRLFVFDQSVVASDIWLMTWSNPE